MIAASVKCCFGHLWAWPRRWKEFEGERNVDVERCLSCGQYRKSPVQFGIEKQPRPEPVQQKVRTA